MILASSLMFIQCTSNLDEGPQGPTGQNGVDGTDGVDGVDGTAECIACHNVQNKEHAQASYLLSVHAQETLHSTKENGVDVVLGTSDYANRTDCVMCHTSGGYIDKMDGVPTKIGDGPSNGDYAYPKGQQTITCTTCHSKHSTFDFANDGFDFALRQALRPVDLIAEGANYTIDMGSSNTCVNCHQPREIAPATSTVTITSSRFGPHHGPQSTVLEGIQGANYAGSTAYPVPGSASHRTGASCTACHMGETTDGTDGAHTWHPTENTCSAVACHGSAGAPTEVSGYAADFQTLHDLLVEKKYISASGSVLGANGSNASSSNPNVVPLKVAQAIWNYKTLEEDRSNGIHNPAYAKALLKNSIEAAQ